MSDEPEPSPACFIGKRLVKCDDQGQWLVLYFDDGFQWHIPVTSDGYVIVHPNVN